MMHSQHVVCPASMTVTKKSLPGLLDRVAGTTSEQIITQKKEFSQGLPMCTSSALRRYSQAQNAPTVIACNNVFQNSVLNGERDPTFQFKGVVVDSMPRVGTRDDSTYEVITTQMAGVVAMDLFVLSRQDVPDNEVYGQNVYFVVGRPSADTFFPFVYIHNHNIQDQYDAPDGIIIGTVHHISKRAKAGELIRAEVRLLPHNSDIGITAEEMDLEYDPTTKAFKRFRPLEPQLTRTEETLSQVTELSDTSYPRAEIPNFEPRTLNVPGSASTGEGTPASGVEDTPGSTGEDTPGSGVAPPPGSGGTNPYPTATAFTDERRPRRSRKRPMLNDEE